MADEPTLGKPTEGHERHANRGMCVTIEADGDALGWVRAEHVTQELADDLTILLAAHGFEADQGTLDAALDRRGVGEVTLYLGVDPAQGASAVVSLLAAVQRSKGRR